MIAVVDYFGFLRRQAATRCVHERLTPLLPRDPWQDERRSDVVSVVRERPGHFCIGIKEENFRGHAGGTPIAECHAVDVGDRLHQLETKLRHAFECPGPIRSHDRLIQ